MLPISVIAVSVSFFFSHWICSFCLQSELPFNHMDDDDIFWSNISSVWSVLSNIDFSVLNEKLFIPFELNDEKNHLPMYDTDPDFHFFLKHIL